MTFDLRSDTVTKPTPDMLEFMFRARVGDDVFGEDETVNLLEQEAAAMFGMEAGMFCPSGTMTNQIAIKVLTEPPGEMICDQLSHVYQYEGGGIAFNSFLSVKLLNSERGIISPEMISANINPVDVHKAETQLVCLENSCNRGGGSIYKKKRIEEIHAVCKSQKLKLHMDGARIFNAIVADNQDAAGYGKYFDSISVCLSKGLGAPVGSVLLGSSEVIRKARRIRKVLGGGMRQAGYMAAAGLYALRNNVGRLAEDHALAKEIEKMLQGRNYIDSIMPVETNIVVFRLHDRLSTEKFLGVMKDHGILAVPFGQQSIRFVIHLEIGSDVLNRLSEALDAVKAG